MNLMIGVRSGIKAGDAVGGSLTVLPAPPGIRVGTGPSDKGFDENGISLLDTRSVGVGQTQANKAEGDSDKKKTKKGSFDRGIQIPKWITNLHRGDRGHWGEGRRLSRAIGRDRSGPPSKNPAVGKVGAQNALARRVSDQDDTDSLREGDDSGESSFSGWAVCDGCNESSGSEKTPREGD